MTISTRTRSSQPEAARSLPTRSSAGILSPAIYANHDLASASAVFIGRATLQQPLLATTRLTTRPGA